VLIAFAAAAYVAPYPPAQSGIGGSGPIRAPAAPTDRVDHGSFSICGGSDWQTCVVDGDTIRYRGTRIRLADIDAPETRGAQCSSEAALGRRATHRLQALLNDGPFEIVPAGARDEDRYGRKLRVVKRNGRSLGDTLVAEGLARRWDGARRSWCG
jgi:micrococcal nuclease